jgi:glycine betaine/choline ABC-type transport system substrate-binding protein
MELYSHIANEEVDKDGRWDKPLEWMGVDAQYFSAILIPDATDGAAWAQGLRPVVDDLRVFPAFVPLPLIRESVLEERPSIRVALGPLAAELTTELLGGWNARLFAGEPLEQVAEEAAVELLERAGRSVPTDDTD